MNSIVVVRADVVFDGIIIGKEGGDPMIVVRAIVVHQDVVVGRPRVDSILILVRGFYVFYL